MSNITPWQRFVTRTTKGYDQAEIAQRTGVSVPTVSRLLNKETASAEHVITFARAFDDDPALALAETGYLTLQEATKSQTTPEELLARLDELDLAREIVRRLEADEAGDALADEAPTQFIPRIVPGVGDDADLVIPENVEEVWGNAAHADTPEPEDNTP